MNALNETKSRQKMSKNDFSQLLMKHDAAIQRLEISSAQMMLIWRTVGALALVAFGVWLTSMLGGAA